MADMHGMKAVSAVQDKSSISYGQLDAMGILAVAKQFLLLAGHRAKWIRQYRTESEGSIY